MDFKFPSSFEISSIPKIRSNCRFFCGNNNAFSPIAVKEIKQFQKCNFLTKDVFPDILVLLAARVNVVIS